MAPPTPAVTREAVAASLRSCASFAEILTGSPLWPHQREVAESPARYRVITAGRQAGKSRLLALVALWTAFAKAGSVVLIISAGEVASRRLLAEVAALASGPLLGGSVVDEGKSQVTLTNGSVILSVPASQRQIRGWAIDLLICDEAGFVDQDVWRAAEPVIIARPGSRVILCSSPWGGVEHFFRQLWQRGMDRPDAQYESWHWPSSISPLVDKHLLAEIQARETAEYFRREYLAEWTDESGAYLTTAELEDSVADYPLLAPERVLEMMPWDREAGCRERQFSAVAGIDWGYAQDAQAVALVAALNDGGLNTGESLVYFVPFLEDRFRCSYADWVDRLEAIADAYRLVVLASELNGVGAAPTETLRDRLYRGGTGARVCGVWTDNRRKASGFSRLKMMLQQGTLVLPRHPELLRQLRGLEFEQLQGGGVRISVPERLGHDDLCMALMQAISCIRPALRHEDDIERRDALPHCVTGHGTRVPFDARPVSWHLASFLAPSGRERSTENAW